MSWVKFLFKAKIALAVFKDIKKLYESAQQKWDTDGDGVRDLTPEESAEFGLEAWDFYKKNKDRIAKLV